MTRPKIGITTYGRDEADSFSLPAPYVDAVRRAGGIALLLTPGDDYAIDDLDGLLLAGGGDLDPAHYEGTPHPSIYMIDPERDHTELTLARRAVEHGLPTLCICRGLQILNVALGGTLVAHLPDAVGPRLAHRVPPRRPAWHVVHIEENSRLAAIVGDASTPGASWHHQAVDRVGEGLRVSAHAADGTVEALEMPDHSFLVAVQWHPELTAADHPDQQALFDALVAAALHLETA